MEQSRTEKLQIAGRTVVIDPNNLKFTEQTLTPYIIKEGGWYDYYGASMALAEKSLSIREAEHDKIYGERFAEYKSNLIRPDVQGLSGGALPTRPDSAGVSRLAVVADDIQQPRRISVRRKIHRVDVDGKPIGVGEPGRRLVGTKRHAWRARVDHLKLDRRQKRRSRCTVGARSRFSPRPRGN